MQDRLDKQPTANFIANSEVSPLVELGHAELEQHHLWLSLVEKGLISEEFYQSGAVDSFFVDKKTGAAALLHILIGDEYGGAHHLPTILALEIPGREVASIIFDPENPNKSQSEFRKAQKAKLSGVFRAMHIEIADNDGTMLSKDKGSSMFPNEWNTQRVVESLIHVSKMPGELDEVRGSVVHVAEVDGVKLRVITDSNTGKIITGFPC